METINHFELPSQVLLVEMVQHSCIYQALHEGCSVLR